MISPTHPATSPMMPYEIPNAAVPVPEPSESKFPTSGGPVPCMSAITSSAVDPYARLGSTNVFSENSFQLITPIASGEEAAAASSSRLRVSPP